MRFRRLAAAAFAASLMTAPVIAGTSLPRLQAAEPVFAKHAVKSRPSICNGFTAYGATIEQTVKIVFVDPLHSIAEDLTRLFRPFFTSTIGVDEPPRRPRATKNLKLQSPSKMLKMAERQRLCG